MFAQIILCTASNEIDRIFDYGIPKQFDSIIVGCRVLVPFGKSNKQTEGYVMDICENTSVAQNKIKYISNVLDGGSPVFTKEMLLLAQWMKEKYFTTISQCLQTMIPAGIKTKTTWTVSMNTNSVKEEFNKKEKEIMEYIKYAKKEVSTKELEAQFGGLVYSVLTKFKNKGIVCFNQKTQNSQFSIQTKYYKANESFENFEKEKEKLENNKRMQSQKSVIDFLLKEGPKTMEQIKGALCVTDSPIKTLLKKGMIGFYMVEKRRSVYDLSQITPSFAPKLTDEQYTAVEEMKNEFHKEHKKPFLIHGITGSGKTELYIQIIDYVLKKGKQAIVLVPEISLTPQIVERFVSRFGEKVSVTHSRLSQGERYDQFKKARDNEISVMIGPRSALFTPFCNIGAIIIDEAHENSYRSDATPKYDAREAAEKLSLITNSLLVLGSATPDIKTYWNAQNGHIRLLTLKQRAKKNSLPSVIIKDMRQELTEGNRLIFSRELLFEIKKTLDQKQQIMLFINRRGYSTFVSCRSCGHVMRCPQCSVSYTYHASQQELVCHYCGKRAKSPTVCPACGSKYIKYFGTGTQKIETEVKKLFPFARLLRMDLDTTTKKNSHKHILEQFGQKKFDILIGTQMIAKGHDFPNVTLVGILAADLSLNAGDYRAAETTFQLITQVAGRAGRGSAPGRVFIQTYQPEHYSIVLSAKQDYEGFYEKEISIRKQMEYPPYTNLFLLLALGENEKDVITAIHHLYEIMLYYNRKNKIQILGPSPCVLSKLKNEYRFRILLKCTEEEILRDYVLYCMKKYNKTSPAKNVYFSLTMNPTVIV